VNNVVRLSVSALGLAGALVLWGCHSSTTASTAVPNKSSQSVKMSEIDLSKAVPVALPQPKAILQPVDFHTADGKTGWVLRIPGGRPIATPAYADGMIFVGGGYGSHEFYAFDADSGKLRWKVPTGDDGPTAAVVEDGYVAFNTESCTIVVVDEKTGKVVWQKWLGDPLMSQPAIYKGQIFMAYPGGQRGAKASTEGSHRLGSMDLKTGTTRWEQVISSDVISAPVISDGKVYVTCFDGDSYAFEADTGKLLWKKENSGTTAPVISKGQVMISQKQTEGANSYEGIVRMDAARGEQKDKAPLTKKAAKYLDEGKGGGVGVSAQQAGTLDSSVGFGNAPQSAELDKANKNVGVKTVVGGWAYQGSRVVVSKGKVLNSQGTHLHSVDAASGKISWQAEMKGAGVKDDSQVFSPPASGRDYLYLTGSLGHMVSVRQFDGEVRFSYALGQAMAFQPALANGNVYAGTINGLVICLRTQDKDADGWYEWGGNAQHNKTF
jgi:Ca-activated chloride channel family protein